jgi:hypothetical protein
MKFRREQRTAPGFIQSYKKIDSNEKSPAPIGTGDDFTDN